MANLPSGYIPIEYIESTGTQHINTGFNPDNNTRIKISGYWSGVSENAAFFGARTAASGTVSTANCLIAMSTKTIRSDFYGENVSIAAPAAGNLEIDRNKNVTTVNGVTLTNTSKTGKSGLPLYLFAANTSGTASLQIAFKIYSCQIYDNGTLVRDFVPCKNSAGAAGLYDTVNGKFYGNAGTGAFTAGPVTLEPPQAPTGVKQKLEVTLPAGAIYVSGTVNGVDCTWTMTEPNIWQTTAERAADDVYHVALTAIDAAGNSASYELTLYYGLLNLITDRTQADVERVRYLSRRINAGTATAAELEEYGGAMKGSYNAEDLNRVGAAVEYVANRLREYGYAVTVAPKTDWHEGEDTPAAVLETYRGNVAALRAVLPVGKTTPQTPNSMERLTFQKANDLEQILLDVDRLITNITLAWFYAGEVFSGEV